MVALRFQRPGCKAVLRARGGNVLVDSLAIASALVPSGKSPLPCARYSSCGRKCREGCEKAAGAPRQSSPAGR